MHDELSYLDDFYDLACPITVPPQGLRWQPPAQVAEVFYQMPKFRPESILPLFLPTG
jgi:hypothetical protein